MTLRTQLSLSLAISSAPFTVSAFAASDNTINFQGEIAEETCSVTVNGNTTSPLVLMPTVSASELTTKGNIAGQTTFTVGLTGCTGDSKAASTVSTVSATTSVRRAT
ncbi:putative fimbrial protein SthA|nr:putative fimbrial protein SthA [Candidatus Pantoea persica]